MSAIIANSIETWAKASSINIAGRRKPDVVRDKKTAVASFFAVAGKTPEQITTNDVLEWHQFLLDDKKAESTIYTRLSYLSTYFGWLMKEPLFAQFIKFNPVRHAFPKPPKKYNSAKAKSLTDEELQDLTAYLEAQAASGENSVAVRDYAIFRLFMATGMRREEILSLSAADVKLSEAGILIHAKVKGGDYLWRTVADPETIEAFDRYLTLTNRRSFVGKDSKALWIRFDRGARVAAALHRQTSPGEDEPRLTSHSYDKQIKSYARRAGIEAFNIHRFRHTFARIVAEETGSIIETQDALGHADVQTTRVYVKKIEFKIDKHSSKTSSRMKRTE